MNVSKILGSPDESTRNTIIKELNLNEAALEKVVEEFKDWLKNEPDVPDYADERLIRNIVAHSQLDLPLAKRRFQGYLQYRTKHGFCGKFSDDYFNDLFLHRQVTSIPRYLPGGYKLAYAYSVRN
ncbi:hypothetical protein Trydic_g22036 [Trypoxylus dichotomus]